MPEIGCSQMGEEVVFRLEPLSNTEDIYIPLAGAGTRLTLIPKLQQERTQQSKAAFTDLAAGRYCRSDTAHLGQQ